jgi:ubiquinone/menaquinone biosynthesis C-methylase UbiE
MAEHTWESKQALYQRPDIVSSYDRRRFPSDKSTLRKWRIIRRMLDERTDVQTVLDMPCGTGRFTGRLQEHGMRVVAADLSLAMLQEARGRHPSPLEAVRGDAARLPLRDGAVDMVLCIRFMMHVPPEHRVAVMRELARVSRRWVLLDVRHLYSLGYWWKSLRHSAGLKVKTPVFRYTWRKLKADLAQAGLTIHRQAWLCPGFSEKLLILCEKSAADSNAA